MNETSPPLSTPEPQSSENGILWRSFDDTVILLKERTRPVLAFVVDHDGMHWPFLREIFEAMPKNDKLRGLLNGPCIPMLLDTDSIPEYLGLLGAGSGYHIAVLSPAGFTTMVRFDHMTGDPETLVEKIVDVLERLAPVYA